MRAKLKEAVAAEIEAIPERLKGLTNKERLDMLIKLLPFILPKTETVMHDYDETTGFNY